MCASCKYIFNDCSSLQFDKMNIIENDKINHVKIVRCDNFVRIKND